MCLFSRKYSTWLVRNFCTFHSDVFKTSLMQSEEYSNMKLKLVIWQFSVQWKLTGKQPIPYCHNWNVAHYAVSYVTKPTMFQTLELSTSSDDRGKGENLLWCPHLHQHNFGGRGVQGGGKILLQKLFYQRTVLSFGYWDEEGQIKKNWLRMWYRGLCILKTGSNQCSPSL